MDDAADATAAPAPAVRRRRRWPWLAALNLVFLGAAISAAIVAFTSTGFGWLGLALTFPQFAFLFVAWPATVWAAVNVVAVVAVTLAAAGRTTDRRERVERTAAAATKATFVMFVVNALPGVALHAYSLVQIVASTS